jgi:hypothetical protein
MAVTGLTARPVLTAPPVLTVPPVLMALLVQMGPQGTVTPGPTPVPMG